MNSYPIHSCYCDNFIYSRFKGIKRDILKAINQKSLVWYRFFSLCWSSPEDHYSSFRFVQKSPCNSLAPLQNASATLKIHPFFKYTGQFQKYLRIFAISNNVEWLDFLVLWSVTEHMSHTFASFRDKIRSLHRRESCF